MGKKYFDPKLGPEYPKLNSAVAKHRRIANEAGGVMSMSPEARAAYGLAVHQAFKDMQRAALNSGTKTPESRQEPIGIERRKWLANQLLAWPAKERRERKPDDWKYLYMAAMEDCGKTPSKGAIPA